MDWFEAVTENFMDSGGQPLRILEEVRRHYPVALHGVSLSIGSADPLDLQYLKRLKSLVERIRPAIVSDHLCWTGVEGENLHDLLPLPFTEESLRHVVDRISQVQEFLGRPVLLENISSYVTFRHSGIPEWEFLKEVAHRSGCGILLDLNNIYVNATNHGFDPLDYLKAIPGEKVGQFHLAGHTPMGKYLFDTHSRPVIQEVWNLYREALKLWGPIATLVEWDEEIPPFEKLAEEAAKARVIYREANPSPYPLPLGERDGVRGKPAKKATGPSLLQLQRWMKSRIQPGGRELPSDALPKALNPQGGDPGVERLLVHARGYFVRLEEALTETYEAVRHVLGAETFSTLAHDYARRYPSRNYNLSFTGKHFPEFLKTCPLTKELPFLPDLAKLEWEVGQAFHATEELPVNPTAFAGMAMGDWEHTRIIFQPSVRLVTSAWPVLDIWNARRQPPSEIKIDVVDRPQRVLLSRWGFQVRGALLEETPYALLEGLLQGKTLGEVCEALAHAPEGDSLPLAEWFSGWVLEGLIIRCEVGSPKSATLQ